MEIKVGDRLQHLSGSIWTVKELHLSSLQVSCSGVDRVALPKADLLNHVGETPYMQMEWRKLR